MPYNSCRNKNVADVSLCHVRVAKHDGYAEIMYGIYDVTVSQTFFQLVSSFLKLVHRLKGLTETTAHEHANRRPTTREENLLFSEPNLLYVRHKVEYTAHPSRKKICDINMKGHGFQFRRTVMNPERFMNFSTYSFLSPFSSQYAKSQRSMQCAEAIKHWNSIGCWENMTG